MIEDFFHQIETELGPLSSDWFEELTAKASKDGHCPVAVEREPLSHTEDGAFRAPVETPVSDSQMSSTPRIFRHRGPQSPDSILGHSPDPGIQTPLSALQWTESSPCLFGSAKDSQQFEKGCGSLKKNDCFGLLDTPKSSLAQDASAKRISESLGAQLNPDLSWSSSFNTPSAMSPTVILTKKDAQPSPVSFLKDKEVIIVRKLFPSLSKDTDAASESASTAQHNVTDGNANGQRPDESFDSVDGLWRQTVPDAIKDGDLRNTVESVLDGVDDVLSIFFSGSGSALRRVKTKERTKKRVNGVSKEVKSADLSTEHCTDHPLAAKVDPDISPSKHCAASESKSLLKNKDFSQWSPLSLSDVQDSKAKQECFSELPNKHTSLVSANSDSEQLVLRDSITQPDRFSSCTAEKQKSCPDSYPERSQLSSSLLSASPALNFSRKARKFVYRVQSPCSLSIGRKRSATPGRSSQSLTDALTEKHYEETSFADESKHNEDDTCTADTGALLVRPGLSTVKQVNPAALNMDHGLDMTQLCKAFAEDFTQEVNLEKSPNRSTGIDHNDLIVSSCMTRTVKMSEVQLKAESEKRYDAAMDHQGFHSNQQEKSAFAKETINLANMPRIESMTSESLKHDSGCCVTLSDFSGATTSCSGAGLHHGFKTANNKIIFVPPEAVLKARATLDGMVEECMTVKVSSPRTELAKVSHDTVVTSPATATWPSESHGQGIRHGEETADFAPNASSEIVADHIPNSFLLQTNDSGFRTASNRSITVSAINLEKAKDIFKQLEEENSDLFPSNSGKLEVQNANNARLSKFDFRSNHTNHNNVEGNCFLTASQKADVTELCSVLEDADSQYEFTQFRQAKPGSKLLDSARFEREWDPDILSGIDFDDSFNCDMERQASRKHHAKTDKPNQHTAVQSMYKSKSLHVPQETSNANLFLIDGNLGSDGKETAKPLEVESKTVEDNKSFCVGFKTAKGKSVNISEKYLSKARSLFADLEDCEANFSPKCDYRKGALEKNEKQLGDHHTTKPSPVTCSNELFGHKKKAELEPESEESRCEGNTSLVTEETQICSTENLENAQGDKDQKPDVLQFNVNFGFSTAGGKRLKVSEKSLLNAKKLLNEVSNCEEAANKPEAPVSLKAQTKTKTVDSSRISPHNSNLLIDALHDSKTSDEHLTKGEEQSSENSTEIRWKMSRNPTSQSIQSNGFKMASGKVVSVSASAIERSKTFFKDIDSSVDRSDETKSKEVNANLDLKAEGSQHVFANGFKMASGKGVSFSEKALLKSKAFFEVCDFDCSDHSQGKGGKSSVMNNCGFKAVEGNMVHSPELDSLSKNAASLKEEPAVLNKYVKKESTKTSAEILQSTSGFSTASGKMVSVSVEALQRAKSVFDDPNDASPCEKTMEISEQKSVPQTETTVPERSWGFSTASGRKVTISDQALEKAKNLFTGCEVEGLAPNGSLLNSTKASSLDPEQIRGFNTSHKGVVVPEKAMKEGNAVFTGCEDISADLHEIESPLTIQKGQQKSSHNKALSTKSKGVLVNAGSSEGNCKGGNPKPDNFRAGNVGFSTASGKGVSVSKSALQVAFEMFRDCEVRPVTHEEHQRMKTECQSSKSSEKCPPEVQELDQIRQTTAATPSLSSQAIHSDASPLNCHSLNLNGCTITQQKYFEQEAMACAKALLEDDLNERSLLETLEDTDSRKSLAVSQKTSLEATIVEGKRMSDVDLTGQPPLKRRIISEFDQISDLTRVCAPVKTSPNGTLRDRRVFNLKPNITHPSRNFMDHKITSSDLQTASSLSSGQKQGSDPKAVMFVPPFRKNIKSEIEKACIPRDIAKVPGVFVPPVKKDSVVSVHHVRSSQKSSTDSESPSISSSGCEKKIANPEVKPHTVVKHVEDMKKEKEVEEDVKLEDRSPQTRLEKVTETWQQSLELARDMQDMRIRKKKRQSIRPLPGSFYLAKTSGVTRIHLREAVEYKCPLQHTQEQLYQYGVHCDVSLITAENAESFRFGFDDFFRRKVFIENTGVQLADGGWLIPDNKGTMGKEEFYRALCDTPGVDPKLISEAWVFNHYRWIVWKRACMERAFPEVMGSRCLTPEQVLLQLKLRYDTEVDHSQRSALKKIMERDDIPAKTLVLCMCGIAKSVHGEARTEKAVATTDVKTESPAVVIWLTDGWYSIKALLDLPLSAMVQKGHLRVGGKVMIHGAELVGSQDACPPLEAPDSLMLKVSANSTRRARWDSKLGFHKDPRPFRLPLSSLYPNGGVVGCVDIVVLRSYPTQWMEKKSGGVFVFRNDRAEDREARRHSSARQKTMELLFSKIQAQFEKEEEGKKKTRRRRFRRHEIENLQDGEELYEAMESDPAYVEAHLSAMQMEAVSSYRRSVAERRQAELQDRLRKAVQEAEEAEGGCPNRDVTPVWKLAIADFNDLHGNCIYTLNIWRPSVELRSLLREGCRYKAYHLAASETKKRSSTASIQFTATKKTQFQDIEVCPEWLSTHFPARQLASFRDLQNPGFSSPCGEVDIVGYVVSFVDRQAPSPVLYLVDDKFDFVSVRSFSSLVHLALEDLVKPFALLAVSNLQLRELSGPVPRLYAGEQALFSINPKEAHLQEAVAHLKTFVQSSENFFSVAEERLSNLIPPGNLKSVQSPRTLGVPSMPKPNSRVNITPQQSRVFSPFTPVTKRAPASTVQTPEAKDPKSLKRKRGIDCLSRVPSPPPLNPLNVVTSPSVKKTFNPPRRSGPPQLACPDPALTRRSASRAVEEQWVNDEELAMIDTQTLLD